MKASEAIIRTATDQADREYPTAITRTSRSPDAFSDRFVYSRTEWWIRIVMDGIPVGCVMVDEKTVKQTAVRSDSAHTFRG
jgi:hypothetical protein